ncbi:hypothetical protein, partial [Escherichia coli]|uniref:hypothetical protein n=1 Tax=Escherichia coli TaxID=562 RepID=UPI00254E3256
TGGTADRNRSHWSTSKTPSYTKSVSWQHHPDVDIPGSDNTGTENINYGVDSKKTIFRRDGFRPET